MADTSPGRDPLLRRSFDAAFVALVVLAAAPAFLLRRTGVMDDSVFWVVAKSLDAGKLLYREVFFTQPPLFIFIPQALWIATSNIFVHRAFLLVVWCFNSYLFFLCLRQVDRGVRLIATGLFLVSAFVLQSYALHTEIFVLTAFLLGMLAVTSRFAAAEFVLGLTASATLFIKPLGPLVFIPAVYYQLIASPRECNERCLSRRFVLFVSGAVVPAALVVAYLTWHDTAVDFWDQVVLGNTNVGLSLSTDWIGLFTLAVASLLVPLFVGLLLLGRPSDRMEWWLCATVFIGLLGIELLRGARHYGLFNLCVLAWMAVRAQPRLSWRTARTRIGLAVLVGLAAVMHLATVREILSRGWVTDELSAAGFVQALPRGSLQVFDNNAPRRYMLLNDLPPAYPYIFVYDTNRDLVIWDSYQTLIDTSPPAYIAVDNDFTAVEYGQRRSTTLTDAPAVRTWIEQRGDYRRLAVGDSAGITLYQRLSAETSGPH